MTMITLTFKKGSDARGAFNYCRGLAGPQDIQPVQQGDDGSFFFKADLGTGKPAKEKERLLYERLEEYGYSYESSLKKGTPKKKATKKPAAKKTDDNRTEKDSTDHDAAVKRDTSTERRADSNKRKRSLSEQPLVEF